MPAADNWMYRARRLTGLACAIPVLVSWSTAAPGAVLDQSQNSTSSNRFIGATDQRIAQTFTPSIEGELTEVRLRIGYLPSTGGNASDLLLAVMTTTNKGVPSGTVLGASSLAHTAFPSAGGLFASPYTEFDFSGIPLHAGQRYALALRVTTPASVCSSGKPACAEPAYRANYLFAQDAYPRGQLFSGIGAVPTFALTGDLSFQTYMTATTATTAAAEAMPEPAAWLALIAGLAVLAAARSRSRRQTAQSLTSSRTVWVATSPRSSIHSNDRSSLCAART
jgi:hypothetical protein